MNVIDQQVLVYDGHMMGTHQQHITSIHQLQAQRHREILASAVAGPKSMHCLSVRRVVHLLVLAKE